MCRQLVSTSRRLAAPERHAGSRPLRIFDKHAAGCDTANAPGGISEQNDVASQTFDCEVFVHRTDGDAFRLRDNGIERILGNCAAARDGSKSRAAPWPQNMVDSVAMQIRSIAAPL